MPSSTTHRWYYDDEEGQLGQLSRAVRQHFDEFIAAPVFFDGEYVEKAPEGGEDNVIEVDWDEFSKWYDQVILWDEMQNEVIVWEQRRKKNGKTDKVRRGHRQENQTAT